MSIPKIKLYRLDKNYNPANDTDIQMVSDDEIYPIVEKNLSLYNKEMLVGVTYRDLMAGRSLSKFEHLSYMEEASNLQPQTTKPVCCDGWRLGNLEVYISTDSLPDDVDNITENINEINWSSSKVPEKYYRINFSYEDKYYDGAASKRRFTNLQIEFGNLIYSDTNFISSDKKITRVKIVYSLFSDDLTSLTSYDPSNSSEKLSLQRGKIYDGTSYGRVALSSSGATLLATDADGLPLKVEGNIGYKIKIYPCRQKVARLKDDNSSSIWVKDVEIDQNGTIVITDCSSWILAQTDSRRPRLFQKINVNAVDKYGNSFSPDSYLELVQGVQYSSTLRNDPSGKLQLVFQLDLEYYYNTSSETGYFFPKELFIRYNEEDDLLEDIFLPDYLKLIESGSYYTKDSSTDTGKLSLANGENLLPNIYKRRFKLGVTAENGYNSNNTEFVELSWDGSTFTLSLPPGAYDGPGTKNTIRLYENGELIYDGYDENNEIKSLKYESFTLDTSSISMTLATSTNTDASTNTNIEYLKPTSIALSYDEIHTFGNSADFQFQLTPDNTFQSGKPYYTRSGSSYILATVTEGASIPKSTTAYYEKNSKKENPWAVGWRICAWEKTKTAKTFVSSFRNWVSDHLNNSPDVFKGYAEYDGSTTNPIGINFISSGFSILYRDGVVSFASEVDQKDYNDVRNWPGSLAIDSATIQEIELNTNLVYAKFAYLDGIHDVTNGLFRRIAYAPGINTYKLLEDPTYNTENSPNYANDEDIGDGLAVEKTTLTNRRWLIRNDSKMSTIFHAENVDLPLPSYSENRPASVWRENYIQEGMYLQIQLEQYRSLQIVSRIAAPTSEGQDGDIINKYANISWLLEYSGDTELFDTPKTNSIIFPVRQEFKYSASLGIWVPEEPMIQVYNELKDKIEEMCFSTRTIEESPETLDSILSNRDKITYITQSMSPYNIEFRMGDNGLIVSAKLK